MTLVAAGLAVVLLAGLCALGLERRARWADRVFRFGVLAGTAAAAWPAISILARAGKPLASRLPPSSAPFGLDPLSAWFLVVLLGVGAMVAAYGVPYLAGERGHRPVGGAHLLLSVLLVALAGVFTARTVVAFLVAWEIMAVTGYLLVVFEREKGEVRRAGLLYLVLTHAGTLALLGMFATWTGGTVTSRFEDLAAPPLPHREVILALALVGFGIKAGVVPVHIWLPGAHAAAPSHVSALLSGVMIKSGIYGLLRVLALFGPPPPWWGWTVLLLGLASALLGVLWALAQHDLKRLLAYHSVENIGIILLGLGLGALGAAYQVPGLALLGVTGALVHTLNHALFKSLLFLGAGVVARATGTRDLARLGGLGRLMPRTAAAFLVGSLAIVGLPPLNGFVSEWMIFRGLLEAGTATATPLRVASAATAGLALTGALALACFTKLHGTVFLGKARAPVVPSTGAPEARLTMPQLVLAGACVAIGVLPLPVVSAAAGAATLVLQRTGAGANLAPATGASASLTLMALGLVVFGGLLWQVRFRRRGALAPPAVETWACAYSRVTSRMQYGAPGFAASLLAAFGPLASTRVVTRPGGFEVHTADPILDLAGRPLWDWLRRAATRLRVLQAGRLRWYLVYVILSLLALLLYLWTATT